VRRFLRPPVDRSTEDAQGALAHMSVTISMPQLGETVTEGTILEWIKQIGDQVAEDDIIVEISTDKVDTEIPSPAAGVLAEILVPAGETVAVGTAIAVLSDADGDSDSGDSEEPSIVSVSISEDARAVESDTDDVESDGAAGRERRGVVSPVVRKLSAEHNVDLAMVRGTGEGGRISRKDVEAFIADRGTAGPASAAAAQPASPPASARRQPVSAPGSVQEIPRIRARIAENMIHAKQSAAHVWTSMEVDYERVAAVRASHGPAFKAAEGFSLTYLPFISRATMDALATYPAVNSQFDLAAGTQTFPRDVGLGIAIDLDQGGLVVANMPAADSMTLKGIARNIRSVAENARAGKLGPDDLVGYSFSITNPGPFGSFLSAPIIPPGNSAILSTDVVSKRPVVIQLPNGSDAIAIRHTGYLGLSWDHRVFDGSTAVLFLKRIKENLETWDWEQEVS
jgi:pyruvate dehydrogenase E2 component (dihydrolipoamide acetyltransferase)